MCTHSSISICPTVENSWGIDDTYDILCIQCNQTVLAKASVEKVFRFLNERSRKIVSGSQYLPPDMPGIGTVSPSSGKGKTG